MSLIPEGYYNAVAVPVDGKYCQFGKSSGKGTDQVVVSLRIADGEFANRVFTWIGFFTPDTADRTAESLRNLGFQGDDLAEFPDQEVSNVVPITIKHEEYEGKKRARVAWINKPGGGGFKMEKPMQGDELRLFSAKMKGLMSKKPAVVVASKPTNGAPPKGKDIEL